MRVLFINVVCGIKSTGKIVCELAEKYEKEGHEVRVAYGRDVVPEKYRKYAVRIGTKWDVYYHALMTRLTGRQGFYSRRATKRFLKWADEYNPDFLWLHNLVGYYINLELLFDWIKSRPNMKVCWTLHSCWEITGHCAHFTVADCDKWKTLCHHCPQTDTYPESFVDASSRNYEDKRRIFTGVRDMTLITPSEWLAGLVRQSYLKEYPVEVRYNTIDTEIFRPRPSDFRARFGLEGKKIVLGVASDWSRRKGLDDILRLAAMLDPAEYAVVVVGLTPKQIKALPKGITAIERTNDQKELAEIYTAADVYVNPSREETFGMTSVEAEACGTKSVVYEDTACAEVAEKTGGIVVPQNAESLYQAVISTTRGGAATH